MAIQPIQDDRFTSRLRALFSDRYGRELELALAPEGAPDGDAFFNRAVNYNQSMVPWIESVFRMQGTRALEIGCGSGAATIAISQKCAEVDAFDIDRQSLEQAAEHARFFGASNTRFNLLSDTWALPERIGEFSSNLEGKYDIVLLPAVLEHLLLKERIPVLKALWNALQPGGVMVVYDTPNRLYPFDSHSFRLPFANWLPDDLMLQYMSRSPRPEYPDMINRSDDRNDAMYRLGRGASYHEFELAIGFTNMEVINDGYSHLLKHRSINTPFEGMLMDAFAKHAPFVPAGFSKEYLELVIRKKWETVDIVHSRGVQDHLLDGTKPAMVLEGPDSQLRFRLPNGRERVFCAEVLQHPWSSSLVICDGGGEVIARRSLFRDHAVIGTVEIPVPQDVEEVVARVEPDAASRGHQAWLLGAGVK